MTRLGIYGFWSFLAALTIADPAAGALYDVHLAPLIVMPDDKPPPAGEQTAMPGATILEARLAFEQTAHVSGHIAVTIAGLPFVVEPRSILRAATVKSSSDQFPQGALTYCAADKFVLPERISWPDPNRRYRFNDPRICLVDFDGDHQFDHAFLSGALWPEDKTILEIPPMAYSTEEFSLIGDARLRITYERGALLQGPILMITSNIRNGQFQFSDARIGPVPRKAKFLGNERSVKASAYPRALDYAAARVTLLGLDPQTRALRYRIDHGFERAPASVSVLFLSTYRSVSYIYE